MLIRHVLILLLVKGYAMADSDEEDTVSIMDKPHKTFKKPMLYQNPIEEEDPFAIQGKTPKDPWEYDTTTIESTLKPTSKKTTKPKEQPTTKPKEQPTTTKPTDKPTTTKPKEQPTTTKPKEQPTSTKPKESLTSTKPGGPDATAQTLEQGSKQPAGPDATAQTPTHGKTSKRPGRRSTSQRQEMMSTVTVHGREAVNIQSSVDSRVEASSMSPLTLTTSTQPTTRNPVPIKDPVTNFTCSNKDCGKYADPNNCRYYYVCNENKTTFSLHKCAEDLLYNPLLGDCDDPKYVNCSERPIPPPFSCEDRPCGYYPHETQCDSFYYCDQSHKLAKSGKCSAGLLFNADREFRSCDLANYVACKIYNVRIPNIKIGVYH